MNQDAYKTTETSRGHTYSYYFKESQEPKPYILFIHGFPCTSQDWALQIPHFVNAGYGIIAPDTLGYGATSKPADPKEYTVAGIAEDVISILDTEKIQKVIVVGHDWGSWIASRMIERYTDRFLGAGFLALGYVPPQPDFDYEQAIEVQRQMLGSELFGYWDLLGAPDAAELVEKNTDSFYDIVFGDDPQLWMTVLGPSGKFRSWVSTGSRRDKRAPYLDADVRPSFIRPPPFLSLTFQFSIRP
jgi:soluble epoxide hydrolase/lipid-phosphate phosphatase